MTEIPQGLACMLTMPNQDRLFRHIKHNAKHAKRMVPPQPIGRGKTLAICGGGASLSHYLDDPWLADQVWACNATLPYLVDQGARVTHAIGVDQGEGMLEDWDRLFDVQYLIASSVHPKLVKHLRKGKRRIRWFHNFLGLEDPPKWKAPPHCRWCGRMKKDNHPEHDYAPLTYEMWLYQTLYKPSVQPQYGLNVAARALCLALWLDFDEVRLYGSDCALTPLYDPLPPMPMAGTQEYPGWMEQLQVYADGRTARQVYGDQGAIVQSPLMDGKHWYTRADMLITAQHIGDIIRWARPGQVTLMGDTLPGALLAQSEDFFEGTRKLPGLEKGAIVGFTLLPEQEALFAVAEADASSGD